MGVRVGEVVESAGGVAGAVLGDEVLVEEVEGAWEGSGAEVEEG